MFNEIVLVAAAYLRTRNVRLVVYLDDWLLVNQCKEISIHSISRDLLESFGFVIYVHVCLII